MSIMKHHIQAIELHTAADMYGVERLKATCEQILQKGLNVENAAGLLALADENRCVRRCVWKPVIVYLGVRLRFG